MSASLTDGFGRAFHYLRVSVDDVCNFKCVYCLPDGYHKTEPDPPLSAAELRRLVTAFAGMGFWKFRLTGGEPTSRHDIVDLAAAVAVVPGVRRLGLSTNGGRLAALAPALKAAGVQAVNVSVDSLDRERFREITGRDMLPAALQGIERCLALGFESVKANVVLLKGLNDGELEGFLEWTRETPVGVRFIELMRTGDNAAFFGERHLPAAGLLELLAAKGWTEEPRREGDGPARTFRRPGHRGSIGVIAPYDAGFCSTCNRLRVTSRGALRLCLFAEADVPLRHLLQDDAQAEELRRTVRELLARKEASHYLPEGRTGSTRHFAMIGG